MILKPNFEPPVDTAQDIIDRNMFVFTTYHQKNLEKTLNESGNAVYEELAANHVDNQYDKMTIDTHAMAEVKVIEDVMEKGTHVLSYSIIEPLWYELGRWYKSKDTFSLSPPNAGFWTTKKWHLNEKFQAYLLDLQSVNKLHY